MKISLNWLSDFLAIDTSEEGVSRLVDELTMVGLEVESVTRIDRRLDGVVAAKVIQVDAHPDADKLRLATVEFGGEAPLRLVCGAPNLYEGMTTALAQLGACLPGFDNQPLKKAKIRGVESCGMLCSEVELGLSDSHAGILDLDPELWPVGRPLAEEHGWQDVVVDVEVTQNRGDWLSIVGVARELAALRGVSLNTPAADPAPRAEGNRQVRVSIDAAAAKACPRYAGLVMSGARVSPSPAWMANRLSSVGLRPINNIVDVTNYVLWELGHPLHAFDLREVCGEEIRVRLAEKDERFTTLDEIERKLDEEHLLICDAERPVALAGIMGGLNSGIAGDTQDLLIECAAFDPVCIRMGARRAGLTSDSSRRFERGVDMHNVEQVIERTASLMAQLAGARIAGDLVDCITELPAAHTLDLHVSRCNALLGFQLNRDQVQDCVERLGTKCEIVDEDTLRCTPPSWRFEMQYEENLIEDVARMTGYDQVGESAHARVPLALRANELLEFGNAAREQMLRLGFQHVVGNPMVDPKMLERLLPDTPHLRIRNPLAEEMGALRPSLLPSLLATAVYNLNRRNDDLSLFELDREFHPDSEAETGCREVPHLALVMAGRHRLPSWQEGERASSIYDLKEAVLELLQGLRLDAVRMEPVQLAPFSANCLLLKVGKRQVGVLGQVDPLALESLGCQVPVFAADLDLEALQGYARRNPKYKAFSRYPSVWRDLAVITSEDLPAGDLLTAIRKAGWQAGAGCGTLRHLSGRGHSRWQHQSRLQDSLHGGGPQPLRSGY